MPSWISLPEEGVYESPVYHTKGIIQSLTANWKFEGEVTLEVSANGIDYVPAVNGCPIESGFIPGNSLKWKAQAAPGSKLKEVKIDYKDNLGVITGFGNPALSGFKFRKAIYIKSEAKEGLFNYPVKIKAAESKEAQNYDIDCEGGIEKDFADVRFTAFDGETCLPYYLEKIDGISPKRSAVFWVKIPQIPPQGLPIYIYYGNPQAEGLSSGKDVFDFFDDFDKDSLDLEKWQAGLEKQEDCRVSGSQLKLSSGEILSDKYQIKEGIIEYQARLDAGNEIMAIIKSGKASSILGASRLIAYSSKYPGAEHCIAVDDFVKTNQAKGIASSVTYNYRVILAGSNMIFQRFSKGFEELQAQVTYENKQGLTSGNIGLKTGSGGTGVFDWIRVRKYSSFAVEVDKEAAQKAKPESVELAAFSGIKLNENGNLVLEDGFKEGAYISGVFSLPYDARIFVPFYKVLNPEQGKLRLDISMDGGSSFAIKLVNEKFYYASGGDFITGNNLRYRFKLAQISDKKLAGIGDKELAEISVEGISVDYRPGKISVVEPNGKEVFAPNKAANIIWSALEYEDTYPMKLEYSLDGGKSYKVIIERVKNTGTYLWNIPDVVSNEALIRISDAKEPKVFNVSDGVFSIQRQGETKADAGTIVIAAPPTAGEATPVSLRGEAEAILSDIGLERNTVDFDKLLKAGKGEGRQLYDVMIKLGDNTIGDPEKDKGSYKEGDIIAIVPAGHNWSESERNSFLIAQLYLTENQVQELIQPQEISAGTDKDGRPVTKTARIRAKGIDLKRFGLKPNMKNRGAKINQIKQAIKNKTLLPVEE